MFMAKAAGMIMDHCSTDQMRQVQQHSVHDSGWSIWIGKGSNCLWTYRWINRGKDNAQDTGALNESDACNIQKMGPWYPRYLLLK
jgi:hypothetical protein